MRTTFHLFGATLALSTLGLFGCTAFESSGVWLDDPAVSDPPGVGGRHPIDATSSSGGSAATLPHGRGGSTEPAGGGGAGGSTETGGSGGSSTTEPPQGGQGGSVQTITVTTETTTSTDTGSGTTTATATATDTVTATTTPTGTSTATDTILSPFPVGTTEPTPGNPTTNPHGEPAHLGPEDACPGAALSLFVGGALSIDGSLKDRQDDLTTRCGDALKDAGNPDVIYQVEILDEMTLEVQLITKAFLPAISVRASSCASELPDDLCLAAEDVVTSVSLAMVPGTYWFVVDSADGRSGSFWLGLTSAKARCGDGVVNPSTEQCDVGPGMPNDGCFDPEADKGCFYGEPSNTAGQNP